MPTEKHKRIPARQRRSHARPFSSITQEEEDPLDPEHTSGEKQDGDAVSPAQETPGASSYGTLDDIATIYNDGEPIDMTKMDQSHRRGRWAIIAAVIIVLLGAIGYAGYAIFRQDRGTDAAPPVELRLITEEKVASGDVVTLEATFQNNKAVPLSSVELEVFYPEGFHFQRASLEPEDENNRVWKFSNVQAGAGGKVRITGQMVGEKDQQKQFSALLVYTPSNFSDEFQVNAQTSVLITSSTLSAEVTAPNQAQSGQEFEYGVKVTNTATVALKQLVVTVEPPEGYTTNDTSIPPSRGDYEWRVDALEPDEEFSLTIKGTVDGASGDTKQFELTVGLLELDNTINVQLVKTSLVVVVNPEVSMKIDAPTIVAPGDTMPVKLTVKNDTDAELRDVAVVLTLDGVLFQETEYQFERMKKFAPLSSKELSVDLVLSSDSVTKQALQLVATVSEATLFGNTISIPDQVTHVAKVKGSFVALAEARYFDNDLTKIGDGPLPPVVGMETTYVIRWTAINGGNPLSDVSFTTTLPEEVIWNEGATAGVTYDPATRQVSYTIDALAANTQQPASFMVSVSPTPDDLNKLLILTTETVVDGRDPFTEEQYSQTLPRITTDLSTDEGAKGKGVVEGKV